MSAGGAPVVLVVAGHDPSPGSYAGVRADAEAVRAVARTLAGAPDAVEVVPVVTAWTDQDARAVRAVGARPAAEWLAEARAAALRIGPRLAAVKSGLLASAAHVDALAALVRELRAEHPGLPVVVDPVLASSSGATFLDDEGRAALLARVLPQGVVLTPNLVEAAALAALPVAAAPEERLRAARTLLARGSAAVVLKGGHGGEDPLVDLVLERGADPVWLMHPRLPGSTRGTGCRFASALAAALGLGRPLTDAAADAAGVVRAALAAR